MLLAGLGDSLGRGFEPRAWCSPGAAGHCPSSSPVVPGMVSAPQGGSGLPDTARPVGRVFSALTPVRFPAEPAGRMDVMS